MDTFNRPVLTFRVSFLINGPIANLERLVRILFTIIFLLACVHSNARGETSVDVVPEAPEVTRSELPKRLTLENETLRCEFSPASGTITNISYLPKKSVIVTGAEDIYVLEAKSIKESGDQVVGFRSEGDQGNKILLLCVNPDLPNIEITKEYRLEKDRLEKAVYFKALNSQDDGKLFFLRSKLRAATDFYRDGWFYTPMWSGGSGPGTGNVPFKKEGEINGRTQITDMYGSEAIFLQPKLGVGLAQYKFQVNGHWDPRVTMAQQDEIDDKAYLEPGGWELYMTGEVIRKGTFLSCESQYMVFEGDAREFHRRFLELPGYVELTKGEFPDWYRNTKYILGTAGGVRDWIRRGPSAITERVNKLLSTMTPDEYLMVSFGEWTYTGDYHLDGKLENNVFNHFESTAEAIKKATGELRSLAPNQLKVGMYTWQASVSDKSVAYMKDHPDWLLRNKNNELVASSSGETSYTKSVATKEHEDFVVDQYRKMLDYFPLDFTYIDSNVGEAVNYFPSKYFIHNYNLGHLFNRIKRETEKAHKFMHTNGSTAPDWNHAGFFELGVPHAFFDQKDWRIMADAFYLTKYYSPAGGGTVMYQNSQGDSSREMMYGLKPLVGPIYLGYNLSNFFLDADIAMEMCNARLVDGNVIHPNWWNLETDGLESAFLREGDSWILPLISHDKAETEQKVTIDLAKLDFKGDRPIYLWEQEVQTRYGWNWLALIPGSIQTVKLNFQLLPMTEGTLEVSTRLKPEYLKFLAFTQVPAFVYSVDGRRNDLLLTSSRNVSIVGSISGNRGRFDVKNDASQAEVLAYLPKEYQSAQLLVDGKPIESRLMTFGEARFVLFVVPKGTSKVEVDMKEEKSNEPVEALVSPQRDPYADSAMGFSVAEGSPTIQAAVVDGKPCWQITGPGTLVSQNSSNFKGTDGVMFELNAGTAKLGDFSISITPGNHKGFVQKLPLDFSGWKGFQWNSAQFDEKPSADWEECTQISFKIPAGTVYISNFHFLPYTGPEKKIARKEIIIPRTNTPPTLDGKISDAEWGKAAIITFGVGAGNADPTTLKLMYDDQNLYIAGTCVEPILKLPPKTPHDGRIYVVPDFEIFLNPMGTKKVFQLITNPAADQWDAVYNNLEGHELDRTWNGKWKVGASMDFQAAWHFEMAIPFSDFGVKTPRKEDIWLGGFFRQCPAGASGWTYKGGSFYDPPSFGQLIFGE